MFSCLLSKHNCYFLLFLFFALTYLLLCRNYYFHSWSCVCGKWQVRCLLASQTASSCHLNDSLKVISFLKTFFSLRLLMASSGLAPYQQSEPRSVALIQFALSLSLSLPLDLPVSFWFICSLLRLHCKVFLFNLLGVYFFNSLSYFWCRILLWLASRCDGFALAVSLPLCVNPSQRKGTFACQISALSHSGVVAVVAARPAA